VDWQVRLGIIGGCDLNCGPYYLSHIEDSVTHGILKQTEVDTAFVRIWKHAIMLGILDQNVSYRNIGPEVVDTLEHRQMALTAAQQGIVLLKNEGNLLPLSLSKKVALIGPHFNATRDMLSIYIGTNTLVNSHSPEQAIRAHGVNVVGTAIGCDLSSTDTSGFAAAVDAAKKADVAIVFVGLHPGQGGGDAREDEGWDRKDIILPGVQNQLVQAIVATKVPTVVVLIHGGALAIEWIKDNVPAIIDAFYPGELGGDAITSLLWGDVSPSGRLPVTIYPQDLTTTRDIIDMGLREKGGITYRYYTGKPLWEFGFGLSYTTFRYSIDEPHLTTTTEVAANGYHKYYKGYTPDQQYRVTVTNSGSVTSDVVVLGFLSSNHSDAPIKELFGYARVSKLAPNANQTVYFSIPPQVLSLIDKQGNEEIHPGLYKVTIGDSLHTVEGTLLVKGEKITVLSLPKLRVKASKKLR